MISFLIIFIIVASHLEMHQAPQTLDLSFLQNTVGGGCICQVLWHVLLLYYGSAASNRTADRSF